MSGLAHRGVHDFPFVEKETEGLRGEVMGPTGGWGIGTGTCGHVLPSYYRVFTLESYAHSYTSAY